MICMLGPLVVYAVYRGMKTYPADSYLEIIMMSRDIRILSLTNQEFHGSCQGYATQT